MVLFKVSVLRPSLDSFASMLRVVQHPGALVHFSSLKLALRNGAVARRASLRQLSGNPSLQQRDNEGAGIGGELKQNILQLGSQRKWSNINRLLSSVPLNSYIDDCFDDARKVESLRKKSSRTKLPSGRNIDSESSMLTYVIDTYLFKPTNTNVRYLWSIFEETRKDPVLTENIGLRRILRIYKACGMNGFNIDDKNSQKNHIRGVRAQKNELSEGQVNAFLMYLAEWLTAATPEGRNKNISTLIRSGPTILNTSAVDLSRGVIASLLASYQMAVDKDAEKETLLIEEALTNVVLTAFHVLRQSGLRKEGEDLIREALQGFSPYPARILPENAFSLAISGCFRPAKSEVGMRDAPRHFMKWEVDQESLSFLVSLLLHDNHPRVVRLRERSLQVLLSYGQYPLIKSISEIMMSAEIPNILEGKKGNETLPLIMGTRAYMSLISAHAAMSSVDGVRAALELVNLEKKRLHELPSYVLEASKVYSLSAAREEIFAKDGLPSTKQENGIEVGPDKHMYISALNTARFLPSTSRKERRAYQTEVVEMLLNRIEDDGVRVDTRFLLQVAELGCDNKDFHMCTRAVELAHQLCRVPVKRPAVTVGASHNKYTEMSERGLIGATQSTSSTSTSRGHITLTTLLEDVEDSPMEAAGRADVNEIPSKEDLARIYGYAVLCARKSSLPEDCVLLLYYMLQMGLSPSAATMTHVLKALFHANQHEEVIRVFKLMPKWGVQRESVHAATLVDSLCRLGRLKDAFTGLSYMGPHDPAVREESRKHLLQQLCRALGTGGQNDRGSRASKFEYEELLDAIAEICADQLQSQFCLTPTKKMRFARNLVYFMQGTPDDVFDAVLKRILLVIPPLQSEANKDQELEVELRKEGESKGGWDARVWVGKVQSLRAHQKQKKALSGSPTSRSSVGGVIAFGTSRGFSRREDTDP